KKVVVSGSGNVAIYTLEKVHQLGGKVIAMSDSNGVIVDEKGMNLETIKQLKEVERRRIKDYCEYHRNAKYVPGGNIWDVPCDVAMPSATQNEITGKDAKKLVKNGCIAVGEGANMPTTPDGVQVFLSGGVLFGPAKAANAGGVATSALEMQQNAGRASWGFEETDAKLHQIMRNVYDTCSEAAEEFGSPGNFVVGANIAGFIKVARAMIAHGLV
ncbi:MAG: NADP-specific glutamate dehydrogenase, partial [Candidatus Deferrimicrobium sp.]|nr:NADP-specific glutamate dehydrogenase [Candidatus Deferrimicrobium sp.]